MNGKAIIFSAPSGAGKTSIVHGLLNRMDTLRFSVSATTRAKREKEIDGKDYYFFPLETFKAKVANEELLEWEEVYEGVFYGTLKAEVARIWSDGNHVLFDVDVQGGKKLKKILGDDACSIFVRVEGEHVLRERLLARQTENEETLEMRVKKSAEEMKEEIHFDKVILNKDLSTAIAEAETIVKTFINS